MVHWRGSNEIEYWQRNNSNLPLAHGESPRPLSREYVRWPAAELRRQQQAQRLDDVFGNCVGYLDGSEIRLRDRPMKDPEAYFSRKKIYGFNLQAICNQQGRFIYAHAGYTASAHDSTAFKGTPFYRRRQELMSSNESDPRT